MRANKDFSLDIGWSLSRESIVAWLLIVVKSHSIVCEIVIVNRCFDVEWIPHDQAAIFGISEILLSNGASFDVVLVEEFSLFFAVCSGKAGQRSHHVLVLDFGLSRVDKAETLDSDLSSAICCNQSGRSINHIWIVEAKCDVVVGVVYAVKSHLHWKHVWLGVHGDLASHCSIIIQNCGFVDGVVGRIAKAHLYISARWVLADEIGAVKSHLLVRFTLKGAKGWLDLSDVRRIVVGE